jgi:cytochrome c6
MRRQVEFSSGGPERCQFLGLDQITILATVNLLVTLGFRNDSHGALSQGLTFRGRLNWVPWLWSTRERSERKYVMKPRSIMRPRISVLPRILIVAASVVCIAAVVQAASAPDAVSILRQNCAMCHGRDGKGYAAIKTPNFTDPKWQSPGKDKEMMNVIEHGKKGAVMPAFEGELKQDEIRALIKYIWSLAASKGK